MSLEENESANMRLVIVDDEPAILELMASVFDDSDIDVHTFSTGTEAYEYVQRFGTDVLLTDKNLPDLNGLDLIKRLREKSTDFESIVITGFASLDTALLAMEMGVYDYMVKPPPDIFDVRRKVERALEKLRLTRENVSLLSSLKERNHELQHTLGELRKTQEELIQAEKLAGIGTLAAGVAHEISSPLFGVMGLAEAILEEDDAELVNNYATDIVEYSRAIKEIVVELSGYSRTAENEYLTHVDLSEVVNDAIRLIERSSNVDGIAIQCEASSESHVRARANELQQIFVNLVKNAVEALQETGPESGSAISINVSQGDNGVVAEVQDNGPGIHPEKLGSIFDPFFTTKAPGKGTGLGLNIVYRIVTKYRGSVSVDSELGEGTTFRVRFPRD